ncbi:Predicted oxidoreductase [Desulfonispora thiosulfatigenes DSM 11270]|uniref:Predicted oxidoreductase n=1 Tax=Desulfonispora thiosulfatigenes DSM 11270 TaxID=656914 RepID=A0A1W1VHC7_DESTI|nr:aldo/keto reductase [Desulfonispora thiosulfatigenes]SMB92779.1 Predicted oxidoreductase [Desulfonispora thiosulfatigenes DSM 11270]
MEYRKLGSTDLKVSEMCFGALPMGPLQANLSPEEGGTLLRQALESGINFVDTAALYGNYPQIAYALKDYQGEAIIASKSVHPDYESVEKDIQEALKSLNRDYIDIFHLHAARAERDVFEQREGAFRCLLDYKEKGYIRAVGIATHNVAVVDRASEIPELDIVFPLVNKIARGIVGGTREEMLAAIKKCQDAGKGLYAMKVLAGGNLIDDLLDSIKFGRNIDGISSIAIGMVKKKELDLNIKIFNNEKITEEMIPKAANSKKLFIWQAGCKKCGICINTCPNKALSMSEKGAEVNHDLCILCGYCYAACPEFLIRLY